MLRAIIVAALWMAFTTGMLRSTLFAFAHYEQTLAPMVVMPEGREGLLPYEASAITFEGRRGVLTRVWVLWAMGTFVPIIGLLGAVIWTSQEKSPANAP